MLLGRAASDRGRVDQAREHLDEALARFEHAVPARGETLLLLGRLDLAQRDPEAAFERFDAVVRDFVDTPSYLPGGTVLLIPRYPTNVYFNVRTPEQMLDEYNFIMEDDVAEYGDIIDIEADRSRGSAETLESARSCHPRPAV